nr:unnamed protein product [Digitaria exilis]
MEAAPATRNPAASLTDDVLVEILRRLPVRSVCRFKCVSRSWRNLISDPAHRKKLPQTLAGFFYMSWNSERFPEVGATSATSPEKARPVSSHFHVVEYVLDEGQFVTGVEIYSSKAGAWSFKGSEWGSDGNVL